MKKKGISLITLAITIVVLIILVSIVILSFGKNAPLDSARVAALSQTEDSINSAIHNYVAKVKISTIGEYDLPEIIFGLLENTNKYKIIDDDSCYIKDGLTYKLLYKLDKNKVKEKLDIDLKSVTNKSDWYVDNYGKAYLVFDTKDDVVSYLKEGEDVLSTVSWFVKYKDYDGELLLVISSDSDEKTNKSIITYTFTFSSAVVNFNENNINVENGIKGEFKKLSEIQYSLTVTNEGSCDQVISVEENACRNTKNIGNNSAMLEVLVDRDGPVLQSLEVTSPASGEYLPGEVITFLATYDEDIYNNSNIKISEDLLSGITLKLRFGNGEQRIATTLSGTDKTITYTYELQEEDEGDLTITEYAGNVYDGLENEGQISKIGSPGGNVVSGKIRQNGEISFANMAVTKEYSDAMFTNLLTNTGDSLVTYTSSNESVATINSSGIVTVLERGTTTITATVENTANYKYAVKTASYTLTVGQKVIDIPSSPEDKTYNGTNYNHGITIPTGAEIVPSGSTLSATEPGTYTVIVGLVNENYIWSNNTTSNKNVTWEIVDRRAAGSISYAKTSINKANGDPSFTNTLTKTGDGSVTYSSSNTSVATVNSSGAVTIKAKGSTIIKATVSDSVNYKYATKTASYTLTIGEPPKVTNITITRSGAELTITPTVSSEATITNYKFYLDGTLVSDTASNTYKFTPTGATSSTLSSPGYGYNVKVAITDANGSQAEMSKVITSVSYSNITITESSSNITISSTKLPYGKDWVLQYSTDGTNYTNISGTSKSISVPNKDTTYYARYYSSYLNASSSSNSYSYTYWDNSVTNVRMIGYKYTSEDYEANYSTYSRTGSNNINFQGSSISAYHFKSSVSIPKGYTIYYSMSSYENTTGGYYGGALLRYYDNNGTEHKIDELHYDKRNFWLLYIYRKCKIYRL